MNADRIIPTKTAAWASSRYWIPMTLWSTLNMYFLMNPVGAAFS
jgi:hypothetical protein